MTMTPTELRAAIEAILFVSGEPVKIEDLYDAFPGEEKEGIDAMLLEIEQAFLAREGGFVVEKAAGGYRFATRADLDPHLRKFFARKNEGRLSMAALETLAIIAYRQPVTAPEISDIRGVNATGVVRTLLDRKMIKIAGRKNVVGSPFLYRTTRDFLLHFGLESIQDLPRLEEFSEILGESLAEELLSPASAAQEILPIEGEGGDEEDDREISTIPGAPADSTPIVEDATAGEGLSTPWLDPEEEATAEELLPEGAEDETLPEDLENQQSEAGVAEDALESDTNSRN